MASIDGGHYFLTVLAPVRRAWAGGDGRPTTAPMIILREILATLPTAQQTPQATESGQNSPFARSTRTHFARFAVIDRLGYNGFIAADPIRATLGLQKPMSDNDELLRPYLLFAAEFDAPSGSPPADLAAYLRELWDVMEDDLRRIFNNCLGFSDKRILTAADFIAYIRQCEIETTMPFNLYWTQPPPLPTLTGRGLAIGAAIAALVVGLPAWALLRHWSPGAALMAGVLLAVLAGLAYPVSRIWKLGNRRFPVSPDGDLGTVLKSLYLQTTFGRFVIDNQAGTDEALYEAFGRYLADNRVDQPAPAHPAGTVREAGAAQP